MNRMGKFLLSLFLLTLFFTLAYRQIYGQMIVINEKFKVQLVDEKMSRLEVLPLDRDIKNITYIVIDGYTICSHKNKVVPWTDIKPEMVVRVKGGLRWDMKIKANKIYF